MKKIAMAIEILIYEDRDHQVEVRLDPSAETLWLTQRQIAKLFEVKPQNITTHFRNIYSGGELAEEATCKDFLQVRHEGNRKVNRRLKHYNLDAVISVGYRINSTRATQFRIWATQRLKDYLVKGYTINERRFDKNADELKQAIALIQKAAGSAELTAESGSGLVNIVSRYTQTFLWLQQYDEGLLTEPKGQPGGDLPTAADAMCYLNDLKASLIKRGEATPLFAQLREDGLSSILGNLDQTVFGEPAYPTIESKAAHLLYFVVKNHPFSDGNKRSGAFLFVDFLHRNNHLLNDDGVPVINDTGLAALTLLVAESDPKQKDILIRLIMHMLS